MNRRIVITGLNIINSLGLNVEECWQNLISGKSGISRISLYDPSEKQTQIAGQLPSNFNEYASMHIKKRASKQMTRATKMCFVCAKEAIDNENIDFDNIDKSKCAVIIGAVKTGDINLDSMDGDKNRIVKSMSNSMPAWISLKYRIEGPSFTVNTACSSSAYAISLGYDMIKTGKADFVIVGGADSTINPYEVEGFNDIFALSTNNENPKKASRPFSKDRDGFVIGEGAGILILESLEHAKSRKANIYAELIGYGLTNESYNIMAPKKDGEGMLKTMRKALDNAEISVKDVQYINAHGTSTTLNDMYETMAIKKLFREYADKIPVTSSKSMIGHTLGAAGAIEAVITILSIKNNIVTPTINYDLPDPELNLDYVPNKSRKMDISCAISNSFAFGGHNATLVFKKYI